MSRPARRPVLDSERCKCGELVRLAWTAASGVRQKLNYDADPDGNVWLGRTADRPQVLAHSDPELVAKAKAAGDTSSIFMPHQATCRLRLELVDGKSAASAS